jgi:hypothetical protein
MLILVPWKPVVMIWVSLSAMILAGYIASTLMEGRTPFAPYSLQPPLHPAHHRFAHRPA